MAEPTPLPPSKDLRGREVQRYEFACSQCGETAQNTYDEPIASEMLEHRLCFHCHCWWKREQKLERDHAKMTIIDGGMYGPGNRTSGEFRGMAGRRFDIEYIEPSAHAGKRITTYDLWFAGTMPERLQKRFPDTARFVGGARKAKAGETNCWDPSDERSEPYPLPRALDLK